MTEHIMSAPSITKERIETLLDRVTYRMEEPTGTTSTFVHAFLDGKFYLATGHSACVSPENFNADIGRAIALKDATGKANAQLWLLEGYALYKELNNV